MSFQPVAELSECPSVLPFEAKSVLLATDLLSSKVYSQERIDENQISALISTK